MTLFSLLPEGHSQEKLHTSKTAALLFNMFLVKTCLNAQGCYIHPLVLSSLWCRSEAQWICLQHLAFTLLRYKSFSFRLLEWTVYHDRVSIYRNGGGNYHKYHRRYMFFFHLFFHLFIYKVIRVPSFVDSVYFMFFFLVLLFLVLSQNGEQCQIQNKLVGYFHKSFSTAAEVQRAYFWVWTSDKTRRSKTKL